MNTATWPRRCALVTGATQGIGLAIAERLAAAGCDTVLHGIESPDVGDAVAIALAQRAGVRTAYVQADLADEPAAATLVARATEALRAPDILVNNAGIQHTCPIEDFPTARWNAILAVNLSAAFLTMRAAVPGMRERGWGRIVNIASVAGKEGNPNASHYSASKAGLIGLTKSLGKELATKGVLVNAVAPAAARTAIFDQMAPEHIQFMLGKIPMGRFVNVDEIAAMVAWLCSPECSFATGAVFDLSGGRATY